LAGKEVEFAEEGYDVARMDDFGATVERVALAKVIQGEARSAQIQFEGAREFAEKIKLERKVINAPSSIIESIYYDSQFLLSQSLSSALLFPPSHSLPHRSPSSASHHHHPGRTKAFDLSHLFDSSG